MTLKESDLRSAYHPLMSYEIKVDYGVRHYYNDKDRFRLKDELVWAVCDRIRMSIGRHIEHHIKSVKI